MNSLLEIVSRGTQRPKEFTRNPESNDADLKIRPVRVQEFVQE